MSKENKVIITLDDDIQKAHITREMNLYQCQKEAERNGFDSLEFFAEFPSGLQLCTWMDAYMGLFEIDLPDFKGSFVTVGQIDEMYPKLKCFIENEE